MTYSDKIEFPESEPATGAASDAIPTQGAPLNGVPSELSAAAGDASAVTDPATPDSNSPEPAPPAPYSPASAAPDHPRRRLRKPILIAVAVIVAMLATAGGTMAAMAKTVTISVDGAARQVTTLSGTVDGALSAAGVVVGQHDTLAPARDADISDGSDIVIQRGRLFTVTIDGRERSVWTTATTVEAALAQLGQRASEFQLSADRSRSIPLGGLSVTADTLHTVTLATVPAPAEAPAASAGNAVQTLSAVAARPEQLTTAAKTVSDLLEQQGITLTKANRVSPTPDTPLSDGLSVTVTTLPTVSVREGAGKPVSVVSSAKNVGHLLQQQGITLTKANRVSPALDTPLSDGLSVKITTLPTVTVRDGAGKPVTVISSAKDVGHLLVSQKISPGKNDVVSPKLTAPLFDGMTVAVTRVTYVTNSKLVTIAQPADQTVQDDSIAKGTTSVAQSGRPGELKITYRTKVVNGKSVGKAQEISRTTVTDAVPSIVHVGTYVAPPEPTPTSSSSDAGSDAGSSAPAPDTSGGPGIAVWEQIAQCESTSNWSINTGNGYYGGLQFDIPTWLSNGGGQYAPRADLATKAQQIDIANRVYASRGLTPWQCAYMLGLV